MAQTSAKKTTCLPAANMDCMESIVNNNSVKTLRKFQVMLSFRQTADENKVIK